VATVSLPSADLWRCRCYSGVTQLTDSRTEHTVRHSGGDATVPADYTITTTIGPPHGRIGLTPPPRPSFLPSSALRFFHVERLLHATHYRRSVVTAPEATRTALSAGDNSCFMSQNDARLAAAAAGGCTYSSLHRHRAGATATTVCTRKPQRPDKLACRLAENWTFYATDEHPITVVTCTALRCSQSTTWSMSLDRRTETYSEQPARRISKRTLSKVDFILK